MEHHKIFPTHLFLINDFYKSDMTIMKKYISDLWVNRNYDSNWQTNSADLHKKKEFKYFSDLVVKTGKDICNTLGYDVKDLIITDMWANVLKQGEHHNVHTHSNNFLSGTYYLQSDKVETIRAIVPITYKNIMERDIFQWIITSVDLTNKYSTKKKLKYECN